MNFEELKDFLLKKLDESKIEDIQVIDVSKKTSLTKLMIIGTGTSDRHIDSVAENIRKYLKEEFNYVAKKPEGKSTGWILLDLIDIFVNLFTEDVRKEYRLEDLWTKELKEIDNE